MKILVIGKSGRDHAIAWKLAQSDKVTHVFVAPGNGGVDMGKKTSSVDIDLEDIDNLVKFGVENNIDLVVPGSAYTLIAGATDAFEKVGIKSFGPTQKAAMFEGSKSFSKSFMKKHNIPTPHFSSFNKNELTDALSYVKDVVGVPIVIKTDAAMLGGQNVRICHTIEAAEAAINEYFVLRNDIDNIIIEEFISGTQEVSYAVITDGVDIIPMPVCRDYKKRDNEEKGVNTDGIGVFSPVEYVDNTMEKEIIETLIKPSIKAMRDEGIPFVGFLYVGIMIDENNKPKIIEYNCRLGDPETEVMLVKLKSDLVEIIESVFNGNFSELNVEWDNKPTVCVSVAQKDYPFKVVEGGVVKGLDSLNDNITVFHSGTKFENNEVISTGGRIVNIVASNDTIKAAKEDAYNAIKSIEFGCETHYRTDIADIVL